MHSLHDYGFNDRRIEVQCSCCWRVAWMPTWRTAALGAPVRRCSLLQSGQEKMGWWRFCLAVFGAILSQGWSRRSVSISLASLSLSPCDLLAAGADVNGADHHGNTALHVAAAKASEAVAELLRRGASATLKNADGHSAVLSARLGAIAPALRLSPAGGEA
eukprot:s3491_g9.t1